jgi:uncharacterized membrane protein
LQALRGRKFAYHGAWCPAFAVMTMLAFCATARGEATVSDQRALQISMTYCVSCHAAKPADARFSQPPKNVVLETTAELRKFAEPIYRQTVENRSMPLGNPAAMPEADRAVLGRWIKAQR